MLDRYDDAMLDHDEYDTLDPVLRRAAEEELDARKAFRNEMITGILDDAGEGSPTHIKHAHTEMARANTAFQRRERDVQSVRPSI
jgi:hypothetical protein